MVRWAICLQWVFPACIPPRPEGIGLGGSAMGGEGRATPIRKSAVLPLASRLERWVQISLRLVSVQETQTAPGAGLGLFPHCPPCCLLPFLTLDGAGFLQRGQVGWGGEGDRVHKASGSPCRIILTWDQTQLGSRVRDVSPELTVPPRPGQRKPALDSRGRAEAGGRACGALTLGRERESVQGEHLNKTAGAPGGLALVFAAHWNVAAQSLGHV